MAGRKTHEERIRTYEEKPGIDDPAPPQGREGRTGGQSDPRFRQTEHAISRGGLNQEDRRHNKPAPPPGGGDNGKG